MLKEISIGSNKAVIETKGAELKSLIINGREIMWCSDPAFWGKSSPVLFPAIGNVKNNETEIYGRKIKLTKHGFARDNEFEVSKADQQNAVFTKDFKAEETGFPFDCRLSLSYVIYSDRLEINYAVTNSSDKNMPFCLGGHPAIACNNLDNCTIEFSHKETASTPVMNLDNRMFESGNRIERLVASDTLSLNYDMFDNDVVYFDDIVSDGVTFKENGKTLAKISWKGFTSLGLWTPAGKRAGFLCIEPWCSSDDYDNDNGIFADKKGIQIAKPDETKSYTMIISAE